MSKMSAVCDERFGREVAIESLLVAIVSGDALIRFLREAWLHAST